MPEVVIVPIVVLSFFAAFAYFFHLRSKHNRERLQAQMDLQTRVLERFESPQEFTAFLTTEGGQSFLSGLSQEKAGWAPARRILGGLQTGLVLCLLGVGLIVIAVIETEVEPAYFGIVCISLGLGFLGSSALSYRLSRGWGLLPPRREADLLPEA
jgi:hypothetical protein